jgi:hypothetical protein
VTDKRARLELTDEGKVARVYLAAPKANIVDIAMMEDLTEILDGIADRRDLVAVVLGIWWRLCWRLTGPTSAMAPVCPSICRTRSERRLRVCTG